MIYRDQKRQPIHVGDTVAYSLQWLDSTGMTHSEYGHARGKVIALQILGGTTLARIEWDRDFIPDKVNVANLAKAGERGRFYRD